MPSTVNAHVLLGLKLLNKQWILSVRVDRKNIVRSQPISSFITSCLVSVYPFFLSQLTTVNISSKSVALVDFNQLKLVTCTHKCIHSCYTHAHCMSCDCQWH